MRMDDWVRARRTLELSHGTSTYVEMGDGPPLVLLHGVGFTQGAHDWLLNVEALAEHHRVLAPDFVGWGTGPRLSQEYSFSRLVDFVREFQDVLGIERAHVVGHSMGGWVASLLAYESPDRVDRLVLVGSGGVSSRPLPTMTEFTPPTLEQARAALAERADVDRELLDEWAEYGWRNVQQPEALESYRRILRHMTNPENRRLHNMLRRFPYVRAETLVVWGRSDEVNPLEFGERTAADIPRARLVVLDGGHFLPSERPSDVSRVVIEHLSGAGAPGAA
jgi:pimeloyl-ACP methyl ester carboxylesterase